MHYSTTKNKHKNYQNNEGQFITERYFQEEVREKNR